MSTTDFSYLGKLEVQKERVERFHFPEIPGNPWVEGRSATQANKPYFNALLKEQASRSRMSGRNSPQAVERRIRETRESDRKLFPLYVITNWGDMPGKLDGVEVKSVPYSQENVAGFLAALPNHMFDQLRAFFNENDNFSDGLVDGEEIAKT